MGGLDYTSARMRSLGKGDWTFGRMEMRAKMPIGQGLWPAFWMLSSDTSIYGAWAASGEIDIVEYIGSEPDRIFGTIHYGASFPGNVFSSTDYFLPSGTFNDDFHVFAMEWEFGEIRWYVDGVQFASRDSWFSTGGPFPAPFDVDFHLLLNMAVGGNLPGPPDGTTVFPQEFVVDYVRVYQAAQRFAGGRDHQPDGRRLAHPRRRPDDHRQRHRRRRDTAGRSSCRTTPCSARTTPHPTSSRYPTSPPAATPCRRGRATTAACWPRRRRSTSWSARGCPQAPYLMTPTAIPGTIEAENYDLGGQGVAYNDADPVNSGGAYRACRGRRSRRHDRCRLRLQRRLRHQRRVARVPGRRHRRHLRRAGPRRLQRGRRLAAAGTRRRRQDRPDQLPAAPAAGRTGPP